MIADHITRAIKPEVKDHCIDAWSFLNDSNVLAKKLEDYEIVKTPFKKLFYSRIQTNRKSEKVRFLHRARLDSKPGDSKVNWKDKTGQIEVDKVFKAWERSLCFDCSSPNHIRYNFPEFKNKSASAGHVNNVDTNSNFEICLDLYQGSKQGKLNNRKITMLRDSGSSLDLVSS